MILQPAQDKKSYFSYLRNIIVIEIIKPDSKFQHKKLVCFGAQPANRQTIRSIEEYLIYQFLHLTNIYVVNYFQLRVNVNKSRSMFYFPRTQT